LKPNPGVKLSLAPSADFLESSIYRAMDNLIKALSAPLKTPVYGVSSVAINYTVPTFPTEWIYLVLLFGISSLTLLIVTFMSANIIPPIANADGKLPDLLFYKILAII